MYKIKMTSQFKRDLKLAGKRGYNIEELENIVEMIASGDKTEELKLRYDDHELRGNWKYHR